jgi:hypothetical protein
VNELRLAAAATAWLFVAAASPAAAAGESFGAAISPSPMIIEDWRSPAFSVENRGSVPIRVDIDLDGDAGYELATDHVDLAPGAATGVSLTRIGEGEAIVRFHVANDVEAVDRQAIVLETWVRHRTAWESFPWSAAVSGVGLIVRLVVVGRRHLRRHRQQEGRRQVAGRHGP